MAAGRQRVKGRVQVYTGKGKGKTTAAIGLIVRAVGAGKRVYLGQFAKGQESGELDILSARFPEVDTEQFGSPHFVKGKPSKQDLQKAHDGLNALLTAMLSGEYDMIVADEANTACAAGLLTLEQIIDLIDKRPDTVELVLTGRGAHEDVIDRADLVTEMSAIKHYFDEGVPARKGIEM